MLCTRHTSRFPKFLFHFPSSPLLPLSLFLSPFLSQEGGSGIVEATESDAGEVVAPADEEAGEEEIVVETAPYDVRIPSQNQAKYCFTKYEEFYKCKSEKGDDSEDCVPYKRAFRSFCPTEWVDQVRSFIFEFLCTAPSVTFNAVHRRQRDLFLLLNF